MFPSSPRPQPFVQGGLVGQSRRWSHPQWSTPKVLGKCQCCARKYGLPQKTLIKTAGETHMRNSLNPSPSQLWETQVSWRLSWLSIVWREYTTIDVGMIYTKKIIYIFPIFPILPSHQRNIPLAYLWHSYHGSWNWVWFSQIMTLPKS